MAISSTATEGLSEPVRALYADAERVLLARIARALAKGLDAPDWAERKLLEIQLVQAFARNTLNTLTPQMAEEITRAILKAANRGTALAQYDVDQLIARAAISVRTGVPLVDTLVSESVLAVASSHTAILRTVSDVYRDVIGRTAAQVLLGTQTRRDAAQTALDAWADRGISGFTDRAGRRWGMAEYAEMATRTATGRAATDSHLDRLQGLGQDLVVVSDSPHECDLCRPWEGKVLSISGAPRIDGVEVAGTVAQARSAGLMHPNCTHRLTVYLPGVTQPAEPKADPAGYEAKQRQRAIERQIRHWKRREAVALDDAARAKAGAKVRQWQQAARDNVKATGTKRLSAREQVGKAH